MIVYVERKKAIQNDKLFNPKKKHKMFQNNSNNEIF